MSQSQGFFLEKLCQISEDLVSAVMTIGIVDLFEEIMSPMAILKFSDGFAVI